MRRIIIVMAKIPVAGNVKTRLESVLSADECAALADAFLRDTLAKCMGLSDAVILAYSPADLGSRAASYIERNAEIIPQKDGDLGERMTAAFDFALAEPDTAVVMIGTDSPQIPRSRISEAFDALAGDADIVLGPSEDGGIYLIGLRKFASELFEDVSWSTATVFDEIRANAAKSGFSLPYLLDRDFDVDTPADLERLRLIELGEIAPATAEFLSALFSCRKEDSKRG